MFAQHFRFWVSLFHPPPFLQIYFGVDCHGWLMGEALLGDSSHDEQR
jgi:hypothetical protein